MMGSFDGPWDGFTERHMQRVVYEELLELPHGEG